MKAKEFDRLAKNLFGEELRRHGFTYERSSRSTFYRQVNDDVYHFIVPSVGRDGSWYCIYVYPHSPAIYPIFDFRFPDDLGIPTDSWSYLSNSGVGPDQQQFNCKSVENFTRGFANKIAPLLSRLAVPYLDHFQTIADIIPVIRRPSFLGFALHHVGRVDEAYPILRSERARIGQIDTSDVERRCFLDRIDKLLELDPGNVTHR